MDVQQLSESSGEPGASGFLDEAGKVERRGLEAGLLFDAALFLEDIDMGLQKRAYQAADGHGVRGEKLRKNEKRRSHGGILLCGLLAARPPRKRRAVLYPVRITGFLASFFFLPPG